ncbi:MAG: DUF4330 domain-containing protein [Clostridiaceae bacterium]|nr:DUF4330 domain-containing protein [Clostridiaceae bacterium]
MKVIDEKGRIFGKINLFDLIVLLAVIFLAGGIGYKMVKNKSEAENRVPVKTYIATVKCSQVPDTFATTLEKDLRIYYDSDGFTNAKIVSIEEEPAVVTVQTADGKLVESVDPNLKDVYVEIEIEDKQNDDDIKIGRYSAAVGGKITVKTIYAFCPESLVLDIREK